MNAIDTNVLVYFADAYGAEKAAISAKLLRQLQQDGQTCLLWQVAVEFMSVMRRWSDAGKIDRALSRAFVEQVLELFPIELPRPTVLKTALQLSDQYSLSHWDSILLAACLDVGVERFYTEDMGAPRRIESIELINPFVS